MRDRVLLEAKRMLADAGYPIAEVGYEPDFMTAPISAGFSKNIRA